MRIRDKSFHMLATKANRPTLRILRVSLCSLQIRIYVDCVIVTTARAAIASHASRVLSADLAAFAEIARR